MDISDWRDYFRFDTFRGGQEEALLSMEEALADDMKFIIAELPTGVGKSDIAMAVGRCVGHSYVTTSQNILVEQYKRDFGTLPEKEFYSVKGRRHYVCAQGYDNCETGDQMGCYKCKSHKPDNPLCNYKIERDIAAMADVALINTSYYALAVKNTDSWTPRDVVILDEAHNLAGEVMSLTEFRLDDGLLERLQLSSRVPDFKVEDTEWPNSVSNREFKGWVTILKSELDGYVEAINEEDGSTDFWTRKEKEKIVDLHTRVSRYTTSLEKGVEWIVDQHASKRRKGPEKKVVIARPLHTAYFAPYLLFSEAQGSHFIMQSATIVDPKRYCEELGIPLGEGKVKFIRRGSPFPKENRPVYKMDTAQMSHKVLQKNLPKVAKEVERILEAKPNQKGLIHTGSYKIQKYLEEYFEGSDRMLFPSPQEREEMIDYHINTEDPTVLVSPSITEGFDGKGGICRFQIICKIPYPSLGDRRTKILANKDWGWYNYMTMKTIVQAVGRGCRSESDWCHTYILDAGFDKFINRCSSVPGDFLSILKDKKAGEESLDAGECAPVCASDGDAAEGK